jgi:hypothetical protein
MTVEASFWRLRASIGLAALLIVPLGETSFGARSAVVPSGCPAAGPTSAGCAPQIALLPAERAYGTFVALAPKIGVSWPF